MASRQVLAEQGTGFLCEFLRVAQRTADAAGSAVALLSQATNQSVREIMAVINSERPIATGFSLLPESWAANTEEDTASVFPYRCDIQIKDLTEDELAFAMIAPGSASAAKACKFGTVCRTLAGVLRFYAKIAPASSIAGEYWILNGQARATQETEETEEEETE